MITPVTLNGRNGYAVSVNLGTNSKTGQQVTQEQMLFDLDFKDAKMVEASMQIQRDVARACQTELEITRKIRDLEFDLNPVPFGPETFDLALAKPQRSNFSQEKVPLKRNYWNDFCAWMREFNPGVTMMRDVTPNMAENYIAFIRAHGWFSEHRASGGFDRKFSHSTLNSIHAVLTLVFDRLKNDTVMLCNPFADIPRLSGNNGERDAFSIEQLRVIFSRADDYMKPIFFIGLFTGLSECDVCKLRKDEIKFDRHHIYRKRCKTQTTSSIPMLPILEDYLHTLVSDPDNQSEYVLPVHAAEYCRGRYIISTKVKEFLENTCGFVTTVKLKDRTRLHSFLDFHSLRHTFCSLACAAGIPQNVVQSIVGHMTPKMTELYSRHVQESERMHWIGLLGDRLNALPCLTSSNNFSGLPLLENKSEDEDMRNALIEKIQSLPIEKVKEILSSLG